MSNDNQYKSESMQARPTGKARNIVIGVLAMFACFVALAGCGGSLEDEVAAVVEGMYDDEKALKVECQEIVNLREVGPGYYRGTVVVKAIDYIRDHPEKLVGEIIMSRLKEYSEGCLIRNHIRVQDLGDGIVVEIENF